MILKLILRYRQIEYTRSVDIKEIGYIYRSGDSWYATMSSEDGVDVLDYLIASIDDASLRSEIVGDPDFARVSDSYPDDSQEYREYVDEGFWPYYTDGIRDFVHEDDDAERYVRVSRILGVGVAIWKKPVFKLLRVSLYLKAAFLSIDGGKGLCFAVECTRVSALSIYNRRAIKQ